VPGTSRAVTAQSGQALAETARSEGLRSVGVFRDAPVGELVRIAKEAGLDAVQLHGREGDDQIAELRKALPTSTEIWAACPVNGSAAPGRQHADRSLFDRACNGRSGGTGEAFDWSLVKGREDLPTAFLAGGIGPANAKAASAVGAYGLDVGSRVECAPGLKDPDMVAELFAALRPASRTGQC
jgi:indole-3-glycerol phosphate synthase / phosphoribosylanthranilate isomerase